MKTGSARFLAGFPQREISSIILVEEGIFFVFFFTAIVSMGKAHFNQIDASGA